jgi:hypothetical protein
VLGASPSRVADKVANNMSIRKFWVLCRIHQPLYPRRRKAALEEKIRSRLALLKSPNKIEKVVKI